MSTARCWFREIPGTGRCDGSLVKCHLISRQFLKKRFPKGVTLVDGVWLPERPKELPLQGSAFRSLHALINDPRVWVWGCGGPVGNAGHHGELDSSKKLRIPRFLLPADLGEFARELDIEWYLDRTYRTMP